MKQVSRRVEEKLRNDIGKLNFQDKMNEKLSHIDETPPREVDVVWRMH